MSPRWHWAWSKAAVDVPQIFHSALPVANTVLPVLWELWDYAHPSLAVCAGGTGKGAWQSWDTAATWCISLGVPLTLHCVALHPSHACLWTEACY